MFGLFKKKSKIETLQIEYKKLIDEAYRLSHTNRKASDLKQADAQAILDQIDALREAEK